MAAQKPYLSPRKQPLGEARIIQGTLWIRDIQGIDVTPKKGKVHVEVWVGEKVPGSPLYFKLVYDLVNSKKSKHAKTVVQGRVKAKVSFDPKPWQVLKKMNRKRGGHTMTQLEDGNVLICGGIDGKDSDATNSVEIWNMKTYESEDKLCFMTKMRAYHTATLLKNGTVFVCGGFAEYGADRESHRNAEIFDPQTKLFTAVAPMKYGRYRHAACLMGDGRILVAGGINGDTPSDKTEVYDPKDNTWTEVTKTAQPMFGHTLTMMQNGDVFMVGGTATKASANALEGSYIFYHKLNTWGPGPIFPLSFVRHSCVLLKSPEAAGKLLVTSGSDWYTSFTMNKNAKFNQDVFVTDPASKKVGKMGRARTACGVVVALKDDYVVALGGETQRKGLVTDCSFINAKAHVSNPEYDTHWEELESCILTRYDPVGLVLKDGYQVLITGGISAEDRTKTLAHVELFDFRGTKAFKIMHSIALEDETDTTADAKDKEKEKKKGKEKDKKK